MSSAESSAASEDKNFKPVYICDLLGLTATQADSTEAAKTYYVKADSKDTATVRVEMIIIERLRKTTLKTKKPQNIALPFLKIRPQSRKLEKKVIF